MKNDKILTAAELVEMRKKMEAMELNLENCTLSIDPENGDCKVVAHSTTTNVAFITLREGPIVADFLKRLYPEPKKPAPKKKQKAPRAALGKSHVVTSVMDTSEDEIGAIQ